MTEPDNNSTTVVVTATVDVDHAEQQLLEAVSLDGFGPIASNGLLAIRALRGELRKAENAREAATTERDRWVPIARAVQHVVGLQDRPLEDVDAPQLMAALMVYLDKLLYRAVRHQGRRREAEAQCERMRKRWLDAERTIAVSLAGEQPDS